MLYNVETSVLTYAVVMGISVLTVDKYVELTNALKNPLAVEVFCRVVEYIRPDLKGVTELIVLLISATV